MKNSMLLEVKFYDKNGTTRKTEYNLEWENRTTTSYRTNKKESTNGNFNFVSLKNDYTVKKDF